jgi:hypothetical protein
MLIEYAISKAVIEAMAVDYANRKRGARLPER